MAEPTQDTPTATQKRPLEEPSSPSGAHDQPEAKRPALDKVLQDDGTTGADASTEPPVTSTEDVIKAEDTTQEDVKIITDGQPVLETAAVDVTDKQGDTLVPDALPAPQTHALPNQVQTNGERTTSEEAEAARIRADETQWLHVRAIISSAEAATVIGKKGENVTAIRDAAGAKCTVSEYSRGAVERILTVSGPNDAVAKAFGLIIRTLNQEPIDQPSNQYSKSYPLRLLIPHVLIGSVIGKAGNKIREIQELSGARLNASESVLPLSTERSLVVLGVADAVHIACFYIGIVLCDQFRERYGSPSASNYAARHGGSQSVVPGGLQVVPYVPQHAGGQMGHQDKFNRHPGPPQRTPATPHGIPYMHGGQPPYPQPHQPLHYGGGAGSPRAPYMGAGPQQPHPYAQHHSGPPQASHAGPPQQPIQGMVPGQPITQQIFIPNDMVGAIIGKGGAKINEIRQLSGSVIKINEPQDNNNERLVTITGTQECNQMALYMLYSRLGESSKNSNAVMPR